MDTVVDRLIRYAKVYSESDYHAGRTVTPSTDRQFDMARLLVEELRGLGIPVIFEEYNINSIYPESEFLITLYGAIAQNDSETLSSNVKWGKRQSMKSGHVNMQYKKMLGYERGADGQPVINEDQAQVVRYIYQRYRMGDGDGTYRASAETF